MVKLTLMVKLEADNVTEIAPLDDYEFQFTIQCTSCREEHGNVVTMSSTEEHELAGSRGSANFVWRCQNCKKEHSASFIPPTSSSKSLISPISPSSSTYQPLISLDCRGLEPVTWHFTNEAGGSWSAKADTEVENDSGSRVKEEKFEFTLDEEGRWDDYDEKNGREVGVREIEWKWQRV